MVLELVRGANLYKIIFDPKEAVDWDLDHDWIAEQLVSAVAYLHGLGFLHRDIKSANVLIAKIGQIVKLANLGLAKMKVTLIDDPLNTSRGRGPRAIGTDNSSEANELSGMWSLGCTIAQLYNSITGPRPVWYLDQDNPKEDLRETFIKQWVPDMSNVPPFLEKNLKKCFLYNVSNPAEPPRITASELKKSFTLLNKSIHNQSQ
ncbi:hypothetical protein QAD02_013970 [Eretmocerus hayati]|uniref:Uncharacterized protein n=1 Tax=Eretmocerus hayati TaxID=131215 RepID=A0ACC2P4Z5_9HYME|nr:hypothetical protein QAD02_013970 [Eretmocerus hayati]